MFPNIDPIAVSIGFFSIRWYAIAYLLGFILTFLLTRYFNNWSDHPINKEYLTDFFSWSIWGVIIGGRLGYVLFYDPSYFMQNPLKVFAIWQGGMSFHGAVIGLTTIAVIYCRLQRKRQANNKSLQINRQIDHWYLGDLIAMSAPVALFFGRLANFVNAELWGRVTNVPWAVIFPQVDQLPRHPSQLYEACGEGLLLFILLVLATKYFRLLRYRGAVFGLFVVGYSVARFAIEFTRMPDAHLGLVFANLSMGQILSVAFFIGGAICFLRAIAR